MDFHRLTIEPQNPKLNTRFVPKQELELNPALAMLASKLPRSSRGLITISEFEGPVGIPDFIGVTSFTKSLGERKEAGVPPLTSLADATLLAFVSSARWSSAASLARRTRQDETALVKKLNRLERSGYLKFQGRLVQRAEFLKPIGRIYAFEAKVDDWRQASAQAFRYSRWSDAASIVLLRPPRNMDAVQAQAIRLKIGFAVEDRWIIRPVISPSDSGQRLLASEMLYQTVLKSFPL